MLVNHRFSPSPAVSFTPFKKKMRQSFLSKETKQCCKSSSCKESCVRWLVASGFRCRWLGQAVSSCKCHFHFGKEQNNLSSSRICDYQLCLVFFCLGTRSNTEQTDLSEILPEDVEEQVKAAAEISMGTEATFYFCGNDLSFDCKIKKCSTKRRR